MSLVESLGMTFRLAIACPLISELCGVSRVLVSLGPFAHGNYTHLRGPDWNRDRDLLNTMSGLCYTPNRGHGQLYR